MEQSHAMMQTINAFNSFMEHEISGTFKLPLAFFFGKQYKTSAFLVGSNFYGVPSYRFVSANEGTVSVPVFVKTPKESNVNDESNWSTEKLQGEEA